MSSLGKRKYISGAKKRKEQQERAKKLGEQMKKNYNLFQVGFTRTVNENQPETSSASVSIPMVTDPPSNQILDEKETIEVPELSETKLDIELCSQNINDMGPEYHNDVGLWRNITSEVQDFWCNRNSEECQHFNSDFSASARQYEDKRRFFTRSMTYLTHVNKEIIKREWLVYSPSTGNVYCFPCTLFGQKEQDCQFINGFSDWKNAWKRMKFHENSVLHRKCVQVLIYRRRILGRMDSNLAIQYNEEKEYWVKVLQRSVSVIKYLSSRALSFRGDSEHLGSQHNGNYLGMLEVLAEYDPFLCSHLAKYGNKGKGKASYLSSTICEEIIEIMGNKVLESIIDEVQKAKYFSLSVDSTPDISHIDQLTVIVRYVRMTDGEVIERFLKFIPIGSHTGKNLANTVLTFLTESNIDIKNIRGQSYDNAANMSGQYNGLQAHISSVNHLAYYIPCAAHSLNLVGVSAAESCVGTSSFFGFLQDLYNFFSMSTNRWVIMLECLENEGESNIVLKRATGTRWCAKAEATKALSYGYSSFRNALQIIVNNVEQNAVTKSYAKRLLKKLSKRENIIMIDFWSAILNRFDKVNKTLQKKNLELHTAIKLLKSLLNYLKSEREMFNKYETSANDKTNKRYSDENKRVPVRKRQPNDGEAEEVIFRGREKFKIETYLPTIDNLCVELTRRIKSYNKIHSLFGFLVEFPTMNDDEIKEAAHRFRDNYPTDIERGFTMEMVHFKYFVSQFETGESVPSHKLIFESMVQSTFPNVMTALRIYRCLMITNATGERSFSTLKFLKNCHRSTMTQERLNSLAIMAIEYDVLKKIDFQEIIEDFASKKLRKKNFS